MAVEARRVTERRDGNTCKASVKVVVAWCGIGIPNGLRVEDVVTVVGINPSSCVIFFTWWAVLPSSHRDI